MALGTRLPRIGGQERPSEKEQFKLRPNWALRHGDNWTSERPDQVERGHSPLPSSLPAGKLTEHHHHRRTFILHRPSAGHSYAIPAYPQYVKHVNSFHLQNNPTRQVVLFSFCIDDKSEAARGEGPWPRPSL